PAARRLRAVLRRLLQRRAVADVPLLHRARAVLRVAARGLRPREPPVRREAAATAPRRRPRPGTRLPPGPTRPGAARTRRRTSAGVLPAHPVPACRGAARPATLRFAGARPACLRPRGLPDTA